VARAVDLDAARRSFLAGGPGAVTRDAVRAEVLASWERSRGHGVDPERICARFVGHDQGSPVVAAAEDAFEEFFKLAGDLAASLVLVDPGGVVRARRDGHDGLARLLDAVLLVPGYRYSEALVGTTAPALALHEQGDVAVSGPEHYHSRLTFLGGAASLVAGRHDPAVCGAVGGALPLLGRHDVPAAAGADAGSADRRPAV
jgi:sigma-54 dependent transcriptional regulator, acetoin dehydrogenase operon transcriptional activator AcoR